MAQNSFLVRDLVDDRTKEQKLFGIQPKNQFALSLYVSLFWLGIFIGLISVVIFFFILFMPKRIPLSLTLLNFIRTLIPIGLGLSLLSFLLAFLVKKFLLRKPKFDDWVYEVASSDLSTKVIFYSGDKLYIQFDRNRREADKNEFILRMAERSDKFSYFLKRTFIDEGFIEVEVTEKQPLPKMVNYELDKDIYPTAFPLGVALNTVTKKVEPVAWRLTNDDKVEGILDTIPAVSIAICGATGSGKSVLINNIVSHITKYSDQIQSIGVDLKQVEFVRFKGLAGMKMISWEVYTATEMLESYARIMRLKFAKLRDNQCENQSEMVRKGKKVAYYELADGTVHQFDELMSVTVDLDKSHKEYNNIMKDTATFPDWDGRFTMLFTIEELYNELKKGTLKRPQIPERKGMNCWLDDTSIRKLEDRPFQKRFNILLIDELNELMDVPYRYVERIRTVFDTLTRLGRAAGFHCLFAMQYAGSSALSGQMRKNIQMSIALGKFDSGTTMNLYDRDYSNLARPKLIGRGIMNNGNDIIEFHGYFAKAIDTWKFDTTQKLAYLNDVYKEQCQEKGTVLDMSGFVEQIPHEVVKKEKPLIKESRRSRYYDDEEDDFDDYDFDEEVFNNLKLNHKEETKDVIKVEEKPKLTLNLKSKKRVLKLNKPNEKV